MPAKQLQAVLLCVPCALCGFLCPILRAATYAAVPVTCVPAMYNTRRAYTQSGFNNFTGRMQCDQKPMVRRKRLVARSRRLIVIRETQWTNSIRAVLRLLGQAPNKSDHLAEDIPFVGKEDKVIGTRQAHYARRRQAVFECLCLCLSVSLIAGFECRRLYGVIAQLPAQGTVTMRTLILLVPGLYLSR